MSVDQDRVAAALPSYEIGAELGRGGWGVVIEGRHRQLGREVAIKQLPKTFGADPAVRARFLSEARLLAALDHPHIVPVFDYVEADGLCLLVMEKLSGGTLWSRFTSTGVTPETACAVVLAACAGLHQAHARGVLHRDVKPENLMFSATGAVKVTDFGIAKVVSGDELLATRAGEVLGTPAYMAPEQAQAGTLTAATDVYAAGVMLYELLSGRLPFAEEGGTLSILYRHVYEQPVALHDVAPGVPAAIASVVMRSIATRAEDRYPSAEAMGVALAEAATAAWGPGWPTARGQVAVLGSVPIVAATERPSVGTPMGPAAEPASRPSTIDVTPLAPETRGAAPAVPVSSPVRSTITVHARPIALAAADGGGAIVFVPFREVVRRPPVPWPLVGRAVGLLVLVLVTGALSLGATSHTGDLAAGAVRVNGVDPSSGAAAHLDLADPVVVEGRLPPAAFGADRISLRLSSAGVGLGQVSAPMSAEPGGGFSVTLDLAGSRYLAAGRVTAGLTLSRGGAVIAQRRFAVRTSQSAFLSVPGVVAIAGACFVGAYAESTLRLLRRGRKPRSGVAAMAVLGGVAGLLLGLLACLALAREPGLVSLGLCVVLGGGAGLAAGRAGLAMGRFRRLERSPTAAFAARRG